MTRIDGVEIVDQYDVYTVEMPVADDVVPVVCESEQDALSLSERLHDAAIKVQTHFVGKARTITPTEMTADA